MCSGSKRKLCPTGSIMGEGEFQKQEEGFHNFSILLELSALDDLIGFKTKVEVEGYDVDESTLWYGRRIGSKKMGFEERTPLMIAAMFGSKQVLSYVLETGPVDVNRACGSDGATALHCAVAGGSSSSPDIVKLLLDASADTNSVDASGNRPADLISFTFCSFNSTRKSLELMLKGMGDFGEAIELTDEFDDPKEEQQDQQISTSPVSTKSGTEKKEYPVDLSLPDIKNGIYGSDEFRMYMFKVKPCSRAYSHDWTECPFVHPGENARRRDPRKFHYSCVPCPEFRKGTCRQGDACEYAHGIFECWLHPAQYKTRLCKDETGCARKVCFFAHKLEELRPLYASTGSAVPSPRSFSNSSSLDMTSISPLVLGSPSALMIPTSTPPMTPTGATSPMGPSMWRNQPDLLPPPLQLQGSRLKTALNARDISLDAELLGLESHRFREQQMMDEVSSLSYRTSWDNTLASAAAFAGIAGDNRLGGVKPTNLDDIFGSMDPTILRHLQGLSLEQQNMNQQLRSSYPAGLSYSPVRASPSLGIDPSGAAASAVLNSRAAAFAKRSQSFIDRGSVNSYSGLSSPAASATAVPSSLSGWGSPDGKLDWGIQKDEINKLRKSASFGYRSNGSSFATRASSMVANGDEPDASLVRSMVNDAEHGKTRPFSFEEEQHQQCHSNSGGSEIVPPWVEQLYMEQEQMVA